MNKHFLRTFSTLAGKVEALQHRALKYSGENEETRRTYESIAAAKNNLMEAVGFSLMATKYAAPPTEQPAQTQEPQNHRANWEI